MEAISESSVLQETTAALNEQNRHESDWEPATEYIPRSAPTTSPISRKIRCLQQENWGQAQELSLKPHMSKLEKEQEAVKQAAGASVSPRQATIVHRLVSRAIDAAMPRKARSNRLSVAFPPVERPQPKAQKTESAHRRQQVRQQAELVHMMVQRAVDSVLHRHEQFQGDPMQGCLKHSTRVQKDQAVHGQSPVIRAHTVSVAQKRHEESCHDSLEQCMKIHQSKLEKEQAAWRRAAAQQKPAQQ